MEKVFRRSTAGQALFHLALVFSFLLLGSTSTWAAVVTTLADSGLGSLRQAILDANGDAVSTLITFDPAVFPPPPASPGSILLLTQLPPLTGVGDTIDATKAGVVIDGSGLAAGNIGLRIRASNITVSGLTIQNSPGDGIRLDTQGASAIVTNVLISANTLFRNGNQGIRVSGGIGPGKTVSATVSNNRVSDNARAGIMVVGNLLGRDLGDLGGNQVDVLIDGNTVKRSKQGVSSDVLAGDGILIIGGTGDGSNNIVTTTVSNNEVKENRDDGIVVVGCSSESAGSNNTVFATIVNNDVRDNGLNHDLIRNSGIAVSGASGEENTTTTCVGNAIQFEIANNKVRGNRTANISINGGTGSGHDLQGVIASNTANESPEGDGIVVSGGRGTGNTLHDITISGNQASKNFDRGISVNGGTESTNATLTSIDVVSNKANENGAQGILVSGGTLSENANISDLLIDRNSASTNGTRGIHVTLGTSVSAFPPVISLAGITNNTANTNIDDGIFIGSNIPGSGATPVSGNRTNNNAVDGIDINSTGYSLSNNSATKNVGAGIDAVGNTNGGGNKATGNATCNTPGCY